MIQRDSITVQLDESLDELIFNRTYRESSTVFIKVGLPGTGKRTIVLGTLRDLGYTDPPVEKLPDVKSFDGFIDTLDEATKTAASLDAVIQLEKIIEAMETLVIINKNPNDLTINEIDRVREAFGREAGRPLDPLTDPTLTAITDSNEVLQLVTSIIDTLGDPDDYSPEEIKDLETNYGIVTESLQDFDDGDGTGTKNVFTPSTDNEDFVNLIDIITICQTAGNFTKTDLDNINYVIESCQSLIDEILDPNFNTDDPATLLDPIVNILTVTELPEPPITFDPPFLITDPIAGSNDSRFFHTTPDGRSYELEIILDSQSPKYAPLRFAIAKVPEGSIVLQGEKSFSASTDILLDELKFRLDNLLT